MLRWLRPPDFTDEHERLVAQVLHYLLLLLALYVFLYELFISTQGFFLFVVSVFGIAFVLLHRRQLKLATYILMGGSWLIITLVGLTFNGVLNGVMIVYLILIVLAATFYRPIFVLLWSAVVSGTVAALALGQNAGIVPLNTTPVSIDARVFYLVMVFTMGGIFFALASHVVRRSIQTARETEAALRERNQQLEQEIRERQQLKAREHELMMAKARSELQADILHTLSHDLKTPLATIITGLHLLKHAHTDDQREKRIKQISDQVELVDRYVQEMLMLTQIEAMPTWSMTRISLPVLVQQAWESLQPQVEEKSLSVSLTVTPDLPLVVGNRDQLYRLLLNLFENAVKYTPSRQSITIAMQPTEDCVQMTIRDSGIGISPDELPHIFEPFYRTSKARAVERRGTGLGLAIVRKIADLHGIQINVESRVDVGTTFTLWWPALQPESA